MRKVSEKNTKDEILAACRELEQACEKLNPSISLKKASGTATKRELLDSYRELENSYQTLLAERKLDQPTAPARPPIPSRLPTTAELPPQPGSPQRPSSQRPQSPPASPKTPASLAGGESFPRASSGSENRSESVIPARR